MAEKYPESCLPGKLWERYTGNMNMIVRLLSHEPFLDRVARDIVRAAQGQTAAVSTENGGVRGEITTFQLLGSPLFSEGNTDCIGHTCSLPFSGRARISGYGESLTGTGWLPFEEPVEYFGQVDLSWPDDTGADTEAEFLALYPRITGSVTVESINGGEAGTRPQKPAPEPPLHATAER